MFNVELVQIQVQIQLLQIFMQLEVHGVGALERQVTGLVFIMLLMVEQDMDMFKQMLTECVLEKKMVLRVVFHMILLVIYIIVLNIYLVQIMDLE